jgi:hypothetical protein
MNLTQKAIELCRIVFSNYERELHPEDWGLNREDCISLSVIHGDFIYGFVENRSIDLEQLSREIISLDKLSWDEFLQTEFENTSPVTYKFLIDFLKNNINFFTTQPDIAWLCENLNDEMATILLDNGIECRYVYHSIGNLREKQLEVFENFGDDWYKLKLDNISLTKECQEIVDKYKNSLVTT